MSFDLRSLPGHLLYWPLPNYRPPPPFITSLLKQYDTWAHTSRGGAFHLAAAGAETLPFLE